MWQSVVELRACAQGTYFLANASTNRRAHPSTDVAADSTAHQRSNARTNRILQCH